MRSIPFHRTAFVALAVLVALAPASLTAQQATKSTKSTKTSQARKAAKPVRASAAKAPERGAFIVRLGADTMVVERYVRTADRLEAWSVNRQPATVKRHLVLTMRDGMPVRMEYEGGRADGSQPMTTATMEFGADTTITTRVTGTQPPQVTRVAAARPLPALQFSFALTELAIARFLATKAESATVMTLAMGVPQATAQSIRKSGKDQVHYDYFGAPWIVSLDTRGRIAAVDGMRSASKITVDRVADVDVEAMAQEFARRDGAGQSFGPASRADSVRATLGAAIVDVKYARPARRGRPLLGGIIPYDQVWRTGANAATMFTTSADLDIGGTTVPAGKYTLWTLPTRTGWQLIVNRQTGQWGTVYDAKQDLARIPLAVDAATNGPELFTIAIEPGMGGAGTLRLLWGDVALSAPVRAK